MSSSEIAGLVGIIVLSILFIGIIVCCCIITIEGDKRRKKQDALLDLQLKYFEYCCKKIDEENVEDLLNG